ncbi:MAG: response regulator [Gemmatimonadota bacterium]
MIQRATSLKDTAQEAETILLIEDEPSVRNLAKRMLISRHYAVPEAGDGREALRIAADATGPIHLMLSDVVMPDMNGGIIAERLHETQPELKMLFMSGYTDEDIKLQGIMGPARPLSRSRSRLTCWRRVSGRCGMRRLTDRTDHGSRITITDQPGGVERVRFCDHRNSSSTA